MCYPDHAEPVNVEQIIATCQYLAPTFGGFNLEDISSPRCMEIEERLTAMLDIPVFHDDQHGTAIVVLAALINAVQVVGKQLASLRIVINGAGAAGIAIAKLLKSQGAEQLILCDRDGAIYNGRTQNMSPVKQWVAENTNPQRLLGTLSDVIAGADLFVGVSAADALQVADIQKMAADPIVFALANPDPEIDPDLAAPHVKVIATGRSDYANQINNVLCFPGFFRGVLDVRACRVTESMKIAAARAIAGVLNADEVHADYIIPSVFDRRVSKAVAQAVSEAALAAGVSRREHKPGFHITS